MDIAILIIDDSDAVRERIKGILKDHGLQANYYEAPSGIEGFKRLLREKIDLVLCDVVMPEFDGFRFLMMKNRNAELAEVPVILLSSLEDVGKKIKGLEHGASDYVTKPFDPSELVARVKVHLKIKQLQDELREKNARLAELSITDALTGLYNRRHLNADLELEFMRTERFHLTMSYIMMDLDHFKQLNDTYGHPAGDAVLRNVGKILRGNSRKLDLIARYGGEEFALVLPQTNLKGALVVAERNRGQVEMTTFQYGGKEIHLTISAGIAAFSGEPNRTWEDLVRRADEALYRAKQAGRNRIEVAE